MWKSPPLCRSYETGRMGRDNIGYPVGHSAAGNLSASTTTPQQTATTSSQATPDTSQPTSLPTGQPTNTPQPASQIGDTLSNGTWDVTLNSTKTSTGDQYDTPAPGDIYLIVDVTAKNLSTSPLPSKMTLARHTRKRL